MTLETLREANNLNHEIGQLEDKIMIIGNMEENHASVTIYNSQIGSVTLTSDLRDEILGIVLNDLLRQVGELKDKLRML